jgi:hypothetical protein
MPSIEMPEVAYLYRYLLVSAQVFTPENDIINASLCRHNMTMNAIEQAIRI